MLGLPSVHTDHWEPLWSAVSEARLPCTHIGSSSRLVTTSPDAPPTVLVTCNGLNSMMACADWLMSGILERHPAMKVILSEGGAGWLPYLVRARRQGIPRSTSSTNSGIGQTSKGGNIPPSQLFRDHMYVCLVDEHFALRSLGDLPVDNLVWEGLPPWGWLVATQSRLPGQGACERTRGARAQDRRDQPARVAQGMSYDLLEGIRVIELSLYAFAPSAAAVLSDGGADVVKVVPPKVADPMKENRLLACPPRTWALPSCGSPSIGASARRDRCVDVEGHDVLLDLVAGADVFVTNLLPSARQAVRYRAGRPACAQPVACVRTGDGTWRWKVPNGTWAATTAPTSGT